MSAEAEYAELRKSFDTLVRMIVGRKLHYGELIVLAEELRDKHARDRAATQHTGLLGPGCV